MIASIKYFPKDNQSLGELYKGTEWISFLLRLCTCFNFINFLLATPVRSRLCFFY